MTGHLQRAALVWLGTSALLCEWALASQLGRPPLGLQLRRPPLGLSAGSWRLLSELPWCRGLHSRSCQGLGDWWPAVFLAWQPDTQYLLFLAQATKPLKWSPGAGERRGLGLWFQMSGLKVRLRGGQTTGLRVTAPLPTGRGTRHSRARRAVAVLVFPGSGGCQALGG